MKTKFLFTFLLVSAILTGYSQSLKLPKAEAVKKAGESVQKSATSNVSAGKLIGELTNSISDKSLTDAFKNQKAGFTEKTGKTTDAAGLGNSLATLGEGIKPGAMDAGWSAVKGKFIKDAKSASTVKAVAGLAGQLESHIKAESFNGSWAKARPAWQSALGTLSK
ncbi:MAG: hypothetical protein WCK34_06855 [Bacteroidota bacterium]